MMVESASVSQSSDLVDCLALRLYFERSQDFHCLPLLLVSAIVSYLSGNIFSL